MRLLHALGLAILVLTAVPPARADREDAEEEARGAREALDAKDWAKAEAGYRRAMEADAEFLPARLGLADSLLGAGRFPEGLVELRAFVSAAKATAARPPEWAADLARAEKRLAVLEAAGASIQSNVEKYVEKLLPLAVKWRAKDPELAATALRRILRLQPGHEKAAELLAAVESGDDGTWVSVFNGKDTSGWLGVTAPKWSVEEGEIRCDTSDASGTGIYTTRKFHGDYDVRMECRILESREGVGMIAITNFGSEQSLSSFVLCSDSVFWQEAIPGQEPQLLLTVGLESTDPPVDPAGWNTFLIRYRGEQVSAWMNGKKLGDLPRRIDLRPSSIGLRAQKGRFAVRKIEVRQHGP